MSKKEDKEPTASTADAPDTEEPSKASKASKEPITVKYRDHVGNPTERTFSLEDHGPDFAKLAEEFKATNASKIIA